MILKNYFKLNVLSYSYSDKVKITFRSMSNNHKGFKLEYSTANCDRNYTSEQGRILHNGFTSCWITITVPANHTISLYFNHFSIYDPEQCTLNALQVRSFTLAKEIAFERTQKLFNLLWKPEWRKMCIDTHCKFKFLNRFIYLTGTRGWLKWTAYNDAVQHGNAKPDFQLWQQTHFTLLDRERQLLSKLWHHLHDHGCR